MGTTLSRDDFVTIAGLVKEHILPKYQRAVAQQIADLEQQLVPLAATQARGLQGEHLKTALRACDQLLKRSDRQQTEIARLRKEVAALTRKIGG